MSESPRARGDRPQRTRCLCPRPGEPQDSPTRPTWSCASRARISPTEWSMTPWAGRAQGLRRLLQVLEGRAASLDAMRHLACARCTRSTGPRGLGDVSRGQLLAVTPPGRGSAHRDASRAQGPRPPRQNWHPSHPTRPRAQPWPPRCAPPSPGPSSRPPRLPAW